jgi:hypothetical protein
MTSTYIWNYTVNGCITTKVVTRWVVRMNIFFRGFRLELTSASVTKTVLSSCQLPKISCRLRNYVVIQMKDDAAQRFSVDFKIELSGIGT